MRQFTFLSILRIIKKMKMSKDLFASLPVLSSKRSSSSLIAKCGACKLFKGCNSPKMSVSGKGRRKILIVSDYPGRNEDDQGKAFVGESGQYLQKVLLSHGIEMRQDCWLTNALICRPKKEIKDNKYVDYCRPNLLKIVEELKPEVILLLGVRAIESLIGYLWKEDTNGVNRWLGYKIPSQKLNSWIICSWNPAYLVRNQNDRNYSVMELMFDEHIKNTSELQGRPWKITPDYDRETRWTCSQEEAYSVIRRLQEAKKPIAFDYETNMVRPDSDKARILSCSVSNGDVTIAYPWVLETAQATSRLLEDSSIPKIGWSIKFENRWTKKILGHPVRNWIHDGMLAAHYLNPTPGTKSLKFQSFVQLGFGDYSSHLDPYMEAESCSKENRLKEVPIHTLLKYNGLDSLLEYKICQIQKELMK